MSTGSLDPIEMEALMAQPAFVKFLYAAIQMGGLFDSCPGQDLRDLAYAEGRRSLALDLLRVAENGQPDALKSPQALATMAAALRTAINPPSPPKEKKHGQGRFDELPD
jgi:hypothetical protein